jgi:hypothetical protein
MPGTKGEARWLGMEFMREGGKMLSAWNDGWPRDDDPPGWDVMCRVRRGRSSWERVYVSALSRFEHLAGSFVPKSPESARYMGVLIEDAKRAFGVAPAAEWLQGFFPYAMTLSVLGFLRNNKSCGRILFVFCTGEKSDGDTGIPSQDEWEDALARVDGQLGLSGMSTLENRVHRLFLPVRR